MALAQIFYRINNLSYFWVLKEASFTQSRALEFLIDINLIIYFLKIYIIEILLCKWQKVSHIKYWLFLIFKNQFEKLRIFYVLILITYNDIFIYYFLFINYKYKYSFNLFYKIDLKYKPLENEQLPYRKRITDKYSFAMSRKTVCWIDIITAKVR